MNSKIYIIILFLILPFAGCITQFIPETDESQELIVVEGLITDQDEVNSIKLSKSMPLGKKSISRPLKGCYVYITDDDGNYQMLTEAEPGNYKTSRESFRGEVGRKYTLHINTNNATPNHFSYQSLPMEMKPVPMIDSVYFEKVLVQESRPYVAKKEACQIYLNTHDPQGKCKFYRWDYLETWEFRLPFSVPVNNHCWISNNSSVINIKNISGLAESRIQRYPIKFISGETDRLKVKYSMLINQYSLNEDEFIYWEKLQSVSEEIGSLYDATPASIPGNVFCLDDPGEKVLGYFSVSARSSKRIFIDDNFSGVINLYSDCISDTLFVYGSDEIPNLNVNVWILEKSYPPAPPITVLTRTRSCADCTTRGTLVKPDYWDEAKK
jgi:hypothetical protein